MSKSKGKLKDLHRKIKLKKLVYFEEGNDIHEALRREKEIKGWRRSKKIALIESINHAWKDLSDPETENAPIL